jgi:hypothetical protein
MAQWVLTSVLRFVGSGRGRQFSSVGPSLSGVHGSFPHHQVTSSVLHQMT